MEVGRDRIRDCCTEAVFDRAQNYRDEGRIGRLERFGSLVTAAVQGSQLYEVTVDFAGEGLESTCTCPYTGPGDCKHVVAVLLEIEENLPPDESNRVESALDDVSFDELHSFLLNELARNSEMRDRFLAQFGAASEKSVDEYRAEVEQLFDEHTTDYPVVVEAIDFSRFLDSADQYRERGHYRAAATIYRAVFEDIEENIDRVDAAHDHYAETFQTALDSYIECVLMTDLSDDAYQAHVDTLSERGAESVDYLAERYTTPLKRLRTEYD